MSNKLLKIEFSTQNLCEALGGAETTVITHVDAEIHENFRCKKRETIQIRGSAFNVEKIDKEEFKQDLWSMLNMLHIDTGYYSNMFERGWTNCFNK